MGIIKTSIKNDSKSFVSITGKNESKRASLKRRENSSKTQIKITTQHRLMYVKRFDFFKQWNCFEKKKTFSLGE
jgi:hypothetical protein